MSGTLYRCLDADGKCLYLGATGQGSARLVQHSDKEWWPAVVAVQVEHFATRDEAFAAESLALSTNRPKHNKVGGRVPVSEEELVERRERREQKAREEQAALEEKQKTHYRVSGVSCTNCDHRPGWFPKGTPIEGVLCPVCDCDTLETYEQRLALRAETAA